MSANVKVTVVTTTYNSIDFLHEAIESIRQQEFQNYEHVVVNDGSTDETEDYLKQIIDPKVQVFNLPRSGRGVCLNFAISKSKGEYIAILDSDDISSSQRLRIQTQVLDHNPHIDCLGSDFVVKKDKLMNSFEEYRLSEITDKNFVKRNPIAHTSVILRKDILLKNSNYNENLEALFDLDLWVRLLISGASIYELDIALVYKRIHSKQFFERRKRFNYLYNTARLKKRVVDHFSRSLFNYILIFIIFLYGLLPSRVRSFFNLR